MAGMVASIDPDPTRTRGSLASCGLQAVLDVDIAAKGHAGRKCVSTELRELIFHMVAEQPDVGRAAHSWRDEDARFRYFGANCIAMDAKSASKSGAGKAVGGLSEQPS
jgi:hypothetical protein